MLAESCSRDLDQIFDHLMDSYIQFGDNPETAFERASSRLDDIVEDISALGSVPHQGTLQPHVLPRLRRVTKNRAVVYFDVDDDQARVEVLAVFFGGQDHQQHMIKRIGKD